MSGVSMLGAARSSGASSQSNATGRISGSNLCTRFRLLGNALSFGSVDECDCQSQQIVPSRVDLDSLNCLAMSDPDAIAGITNANELPPTILLDEEVRDLIALLHALTHVSSIHLPGDAPGRTTSGLLLADLA